MENNIDNGKLISRGNQLIELGMEKTGYGYVTKGFYVPWQEILIMNDYTWKIYLSQIRIRIENTAKQIELHNKESDADKIAKWIKSIESIPRPDLQNESHKQTMDVVYDTQKNLIYWLRKEAKID